MEVEREENEVQAATESDDDDEQPIYNPMKLPMGWDGKPIPYWLYKLHGLGQEFKCEICGNQSYWGRRAYERHFKEWRHQHGMRCLGIPNSKNFNEITSIEEAKQLWDRTSGVRTLKRSSPWVTLSRSFLEYCVLGYDNLPRALLMSTTNVVLYQELLQANCSKRAAFARQFAKDKEVLDIIDKKILKRGRKRVTPGACTGRKGWLTDPCLQWVDVKILKPGKHAKEFKESMSNLLDDWNSQSNQCVL
ncbi:hypothetical protein ACET3Z_030040 [Daucus carota]